MYSTPRMSYEPERPDEVVVDVVALAYGKGYAQNELDEYLITDLIGDYLSDKYGFCCYGFNMEYTEPSHNIMRVFNIDWNY